MDELPDVRVLLVEDEGGVALLLEDMLSELGCDVVASAANLATAYEASQALAFDLVVLDINMGGERSCDFARSLVERGVPFVFSTGYGRDGLPTDLESRPVLTKPYRLADLSRQIAATLRLDRTGPA